MKRKYLSKNYIDLANAIVTQAADDYRDVLHKLKKFPDNDILKAERYELESFFKGEWIMMLTNADGNYIMHELQKEAGMI